MSVPEEPSGSESRPTWRQPRTVAGSLDAFGEFVREAMRAGRGEPGAEAPDRIDKFRVLDKLGEGTYGRVYRVHDPDLDCDRAAKLPTEMVLASPALRGEFLREARNLQKIDDHPNVVRVVQAGEDDGRGRPYFVMEYCPDHSLASWLRGRARGWRGDERWAARLVAQVADGVHRIHQQRLCHRDLKPGNILLVRIGAGQGGDPDRPDFRPKVADLGLASFLDDPAATASLSRGPVGTMAYMAPEQARGRRREIGPATDVYGLGAILFEVVAGRRAYASASCGEIFESLQSDVPSPPLKGACPKASRAMCTVVGTAMRKDARYRYATAAEMADDLKRLADGRPVRGATWPRKAFYFLSKRRAGAAGVVAAAAVAAGGAEMWRLERAAAASAWLGRMETATPSELADLVRERDGGDPSVSPRLAAMFGSEEPTRKLSAALALASRRPECARYVVDRLLGLPPRDMGPIARAAARAVPDLPDRLEAELANHGGDGRAPGEPSRRRAGAALSLALLGRPWRSLEPLGDLADPDARALFVHGVGPASVPPSALLELASSPLTPTAARRQLLLAMGEIPAAGWRADDRARAVELAAQLYANDRDAGVHGASRWLLRSWGEAARVVQLDAGLVSPDYRPGFGWRRDPSGLTFVLVAGSPDGHRFEISDTEVPCRLYQEHAPEFDRRVYDHVLADDEPALNVTFLDGARFANWMSERSGLPPAFPPAVGVENVPPAAEVLASRGYRLPTTGEFALAAMAGTATPRYFGELRDLIPRYAFTADSLGRPSVQAVGLLKPNDLGLFDVLGNALELCHFDGELTRGRRNQVSSCGGSGIQSSANLAAAPRGEPAPATTPFIPSGFRLARTLSTAVGPPR
ncbi:Serine/threonine-protein kinase PrkC [Aquisphaera giovannonii]|uniref:Serine/threonine-protein kinase PrkC n=1 Tax=Aquisphaera giovannonii TaxID=406548 RepID=A0A5B9W3N0_9BACT|nr:bifunctional serine/threonine-protein kinase/formylglycine-generating enzyme family protein [Aquisphaera giovannonii]QEH34857.1 Serine/threonine-protein kinase PrkC [Aquisphaera giovannonii]